MKNINKNTNTFGGNAIDNDMYRLLDGYKPSSSSSSKKGSIVGNTTSKSTSISSRVNSLSSSNKAVKFTSSSSPARSTTSSSSGSANRSSNSSSRGGSFSGGGFGGNRYSSSSNTSGSKTDTSQVNAVRFTNNSSSSNRTNSSSHVEAVRFTGNNPASGKTPAGAEFLNVPVERLKRGTSDMGSGVNSRNAGTISYDLNKDITKLGNVVNNAIKKGTYTAASGAVAGALGPMASTKFVSDKVKKENERRKKSKSIFSAIRNIFSGNKKKQSNTAKTISPSTVNYEDVMLLRNNFNKSPTANKVSTESKIESITGRTSNNNYTEYDVDKLASLIYRETGGSFRNSGKSEEWFAFLNTAAVAMNNQARSGKGNTVGDRICSLSNNVYSGLSDYANTDFDTVTAGASEEQKEMARNAAKMALSGQYTLPSNMYLQASASIVNRYGNTWNTHNPSSGGMDVHIGYEGSSASTTDLYGNEVPTDVESYRNEAEALRRALESTNNTANNYLGNLDPNDIRQL